MCGVPEAMLTGEMARVSVEVLKVGQVSLNSLHLTSSLPPQGLLDKVQLGPQLSRGPATHFGPPSGLVVRVCII